MTISNYQALKNKVAEQEKIIKELQVLPVESADRIAELEKALEESQTECEQIKRRVIKLLDKFDIEKILGGK